MSFLQIDQVTKSYSGHVAIRDLSFTIPNGAIFGLLGPNGAGKTTLIRIINQITAADSGEIRFDGQVLGPQHISRIGYLPEERGLYKKMKVLEQIVYFARLKDMPKKEAMDKALYWLKHFDIEEWKYKKIEELSKGMQQKVQFILTILHEPELVILDEPFSGFDPVNTELIKGEIRRLKERGSTIIFSTHRMESVEEICDYVGMINKSKRVLEGSVQDVRNSYSKNAYEAEFVGSAEGLSFQPTMVKNLHGSGRVVAEFQLANESDRSALINDLNQHTQLFNFYEKLPSMHEIFIQKVEEGKHEQD